MWQGNKKPTHEVMRSGGGNEDGGRRMSCQLAAPEVQLGFTGRGWKGGDVTNPEWRLSGKRRIRGRRRRKGREEGEGEKEGDKEVEEGK